MRKEKDTESDSDLLVTYVSGCGSARPKNIQIFRMRIRITNTAKRYQMNCCVSESVTSRLGRTGFEMNWEVGSGPNHSGSKTLKKGHLLKKVMGSLKFKAHEENRTETMMK